MRGRAPAGDLGDPGSRTACQERTSVPRRVSDAAMSERAECVMLNKGPYINDAVVAIDNILARMTHHHYKKNALLRSLHSWRPD